MDSVLLGRSIGDWAVILGVGAVTLWLLGVRGPARAAVRVQQEEPPHEESPQPSQYSDFATNLLPPRTRRELWSRQYARR